MHELERTHGPFEPVERTRWPGGEGVRGMRAASRVLWLALSPSRLVREREGYARLSGDARVPAMLDNIDDGLALEASLGGAPVAGEVARREPWEGTRRELLARWTGVRPGKALRRLAKPAKLDRWLDASIALELSRGSSLGGVLAWGRAGGRDVALRFEHADPDGYVALDRAAQVIVEGDDASDELEVDLAIGALLIREGDPSLADWLAARLPGVEPERVRVTIHGPSFVPVDAWEPPGAEVTASRARWLLQNVDGLAVGGERMRVEVEPPIRKGRRPPPRAPRAERRRRLFARWDEGIRVDDEGLFSATPEALALRIAEGARGVVLDGTCGVGALALALARQPTVTRVIAGDVDEARVAMAAHNARVYGVAERVRFEHVDALALVRAHPEADLLVLDPPWGGRDYDRARVRLSSLGMDVRAVFEAFDGPVVLKLPRSFDVAQLGEGWSVEALLDDRGVLKMLVARRGLP